MNPWHASTVAVVDQWLASFVPAGVDLTPTDQELARQVIRGSYEQQIAALFGVYRDGQLSPTLATALVPERWRFRPARGTPPGIDWLPLFRLAAFTHDFELGRQPRRSAKLFPGSNVGAPARDQLDDE